METREQSMEVPMAHAHHGTPPQDDSTNSIVQHNYGSVCCYVACSQTKPIVEQLGR